MKLSFTEEEMLESENVCLNFDFECTQKIAEKIGTNRIIFTGMGSSLIFPGKQAKNRALHLNIANKIEVYLASDLFQYEDFSRTTVFLSSNSGNTKEVIQLLEYIQSRGATCIALTAVADSVLAQRSDERIILSCGFEKGVAATKSVVEQGLIYDSLILNLAKIQGKQVDLQIYKNELKKTAHSIKNNINTKIDTHVLETLKTSNTYFFVGLDTGVAEEITLKSYEITHKLAIFYPDTHIVHGVAEAIEGNCAIIFHPSNFKRYLSDFVTFSRKTNCKLIGIGNDNSISGMHAEVNSLFPNYCLLTAGWGLLRTIANELHVDIDHPEKASKVGNPFTE